MTSLNRRDFLRLASSGAALMALPGAMPAAQPSASPAGRPNIIFLLTDDQRWNSLGCMGDPVLKTPHIDTLAREGTLFTHACVTTSICCCSRASIFTGQYTSRHGIRDFVTTFTPEALARTYPALLRQRGYHTGFIGKYGVGGKLPPDAFDYCKATPQLTSPFVKDERGERVHNIELSARHALEFLKSCPKDKPFCLSLSFNAPHAEDGNPKQYICQPGDEALYENDTIPVPKTATQQHFEALPPFFRRGNEGRNRWTWRFDTPARYQEYVKAYYRLLTEIDRVVGQIREGLKAQGQDRNTVIMFMGDNGYFLGEHGLADKWFPYEESIRVPLVVYDPRLGRERRGRRVDEFVLNVDIAPTILALAGCPAPSVMQGADFSPLLRGERPAAWRTDFFYEHPQGGDADFIPASEALVTQDLKYILWPGRQYEELFDLRKDPLEEHNVVKEPAYLADLERLRMRFARLKQAAG